MANWRAILHELFPDGEFTTPATEQELNEIEQALRICLPGDLRLLLSETNGVRDSKYGYAHLWSTQRILQENREFHEHLGIWGNAYQPLTFFADAGNGDYFGFLSNSHELAVRSEVYVWDHEDDSIQQIAPTIHDFTKAGSQENRRSDSSWVKMRT